MPATGRVVHDVEETKSELKIVFNEATVNRWKLLRELGCGNNVNGQVCAALLDGQPGWVVKLVGAENLGTFEFAAAKLLASASPPHPKGLPRLPKDPSLRTNLAWHSSDGFGYRWVAMEEIRGGTLASQMSLYDARGQRCGSRTVTRIAVQIIHALSFLNARGYLHGDAHPDNIMFRAPDQDPSCSVCVVDFGFLTEIGTVNQSGAYALRSAYYVENHDKKNDHGLLTAYNDVEGALYLALLMRGVPSDFLVRNKLDLINAVRKIDAALNIQMDEWMVRLLNVLEDVRGQNNADATKYDVDLVKTWCEALVLPDTRVYKPIGWPSLENAPKPDIVEELYDPPPRTRVCTACARAY